MQTSVDKGRAGEELAQRYLEQRGLSLLGRNYRCRSGEIDLIMEDRGQLVFVEVRARKNDHYGHALETIDRRKQQRLRRTAETYLQHSALTDRNCRFDVIAISNAAEPVIEWIKDAIFD